MKRFQINDAKPRFDPDDQEGFRSAMHRFGPEIGASKLGGSVYEIPPGQALCPYHYETSEEEWLLALDGQASVRHPGGVERLERGELVCFEPGPAGAHQVFNEGEEPIRVLMISTVEYPAVCVYPDSDKLGVYFRDRSENVIVERSSAVDYFEGERFPRAQ